MYRNYILKVVKEGLYEGIGFEGKPSKVKRYEHIPLLSLNELKGKRVYLLLKTNRFFFENYNLHLPLFSPDIIRLKLQDRVNSLGYFSRPVSIYWKVREQRDSFHRISYLAVEREFVEEEIKKLKEVGEARVEGITFLPLSLAASIPKDPEDKIILHKEQEGLWILLMNNGNIHLIEYLPIDEFLGLNIEELKGRISFLQNLYYRDTQRNLKIIYSTNKDLLEELGDLDLQRKIIERDFPEYFGFFHLEPEFNFLPEDERAIKLVLESNYKIALILMFFSFLFTLSTVGLHLINKGLEKEILRKETLINESLQRLLAHYPEDKLKAFRNYLEEKGKLQKSPNPETLLINLTKGLEGTKINHLEVKREGEAYTFLLKGEKIPLPKDISLFTEHLLRSLQPLVLIKESKIDYSVQENKIFFEIKGNLHQL